jgi:two-component system, response regulator PdtaR
VLKFFFLKQPVFTRVVRGTFDKLFCREIFYLVIGGILIFPYIGIIMAQQIKIMIVEDEAITAMYLLMRLKRLSYEVLKPIGSGENAIQIAQKESPNIILMDIGLAGKLDGIQTAREIQSFCDAHFIFMSGYQDEDMRDDVKSIKSSSYLTKPIGIKDIVNIIEMQFNELS